MAIRTVSQLVPLSGIRPVPLFPLSAITHSDLIEVSITGTPGTVFAPTLETSGYFNARGFASAKLRMVELMTAVSAEFFSSGSSVLSSFINEVSAHLFTEQVDSNTGNFTNDGYIKIVVDGVEKWIPIYNRT